MDNRPVASRRVEPDKWRCGSDGLHVVTLERSGALMDKVPNHGQMQRSAIHVLRPLGRTGDVERAGAAAGSYSKR